MNVMEDEEKKEKERIRSRKRYWENVEKSKERSKTYYKKHKDVRDKWRETKYARASQQYQNYKKMDRRNGFGEAIDFTPQWIVDNIYSKTCVHCGKSDWHKLGCNRIDNTKPHTMDNVEPCCYDCNIKLGGIENGKRVAKQVSQIDKDTDEIIKIWNSAEDAAKELGLNSSHIRSCARGERKTHGGYKWL